MTATEPSTGAMLLAAIWLHQLWEQCDREAGRVSNLRGAVEERQRAVRACARVEEVLAATEREGPLPPRFAGMRAAVGRWATSYRNALRDLPALPARGRGRESREATWLALVLERAPDLPRTAGPWMRWADAWGCCVESTELLAPSAHQRRRAFWKQLLHRCPTRGGSQNA